ncbi:InlB B-repeat-containing protein [Virgibacillus sp. W0181]|uniref:InlB B-repeat-containing protein n=1 Tax=Virgibacillus sp. W0181 TaxID=3391581 RepID=UPI003F48A27B
MKKRDVRRLNKGITIWVIVMLLIPMLPVMPMSASAEGTSKPITIAQGAQGEPENGGLGFNDGFSPDYWNIGMDADLEGDRIVLTPKGKNKTGFAYMKNSIHLREDLSFNAKYTFKISESDTYGADGIAFVIQSKSNTAGPPGGAMGYSGIGPSVVVEIDTYENEDDPSESHIAIMKNGNYKEHLASKNIQTIDHDNNLYSVWVDYSDGQMKVYFAEDNSGNATKPETPHVSHEIDFKEIFGETRDVFVGFSSATGWSYSKHEILGVLFDSEYTSAGIKENDNYVQAPKPDAPAAMTITKQEDQEVTVTPEAGKTYIFYENKEDVKPISSGTELVIEPSMNTNGKKYYYSIVENGVQSDRAPIEVLMEDKGISTSEGSTTFETGNPEIIDENITIDIYSIPTLDQASVVIDNFKIGDMLSFTNQGGISGSYNDENGVLTLNGEATVEEYQAALRSVTFSTISTSAAEREITFTISPNDVNMSDKKTMKKAKYSAQVIHGSGDGEYTSGTKVSITAEEAPEDQRFKSWEVTSGDVTLANAKESSTTFTMPANPVELKATYEVIPYEVTVKNGIGDGEYTLGTTVTITAEEASEGQRFKSWEVTNGDVTLADIKASTTTFIMPSGPVEVKVVYESIYAMTVENGTGTGAYAEGDTVTITAGKAFEGQRFKAWEVLSGDLTLTNEKESITTFTMPSGPVEVKATYEVIPYEVTVENGTGGGEYTPSAKVSITAEEAPEGQRFKAWEVTSGDVTLTNAKESSTTFTMPANPVELKATYEVIPYEVTVENGIGDGAYTPGTTVTITAEEAPEGQRFKSWEVTSGDVTLANAKESSTTFTMPANPVELKATYEVIPYEVTVKNGIGDGEYTPGTTVTITAEEASEGQRFKSWKVTKGVVDLKQTTSAEATFKMPSEAVIVEAVYKNLTEEEIKEQLEEAANFLTLETAFTFSKEDTWESITLPFFMLTEGKHDTTIEWTSSNPDVISIDGHSATTYRQKKGKSVILTATVSKGDYSIKKTFLLIVKSNLVKNKASESIKRKAGIKYGKKNTTLNLIERINLYDNNNLLINKIDKIIVNEQMITSNLNNRFSVYLSDDLSDPADELAIEINSAALQKIKGDLEVKTDQATILLSKEEINRLNKSILDLYFRVVPVRNEQTKEDIKKGISADSSLQSLLNSIHKDAIAKMLGTPKEIETNYSGYRTEVILPITEFYHEGMDLDNIRVYIEHSDGTIDIQEGTITYDKDTPVGFKFAIDKFSTFTLLEIEVPEDASSDANEGNNGVDGQEPTADHDNSNGNQVSINDNNVDVESQENNEQGESLPMTASNMFSYLFVGLLLLIAGLSIYYYRRFRKNG